jgi:hypothetical protein
MKSPFLGHPNPPPREATAELVELSEKMAGLHARLEFLDELTRKIETWPHWTDELGLSWDALLETLRDEALEQMYVISTQATGLKCRSHLELYAKSRIWRMRRIPEQNDDVTLLAEAICFDVRNLLG